MHPESTLSQLIYVSRLKQRLSADALSTLVAQSATNNARQAISGVLLLHGQSTLQLLEGDAAAIERLFIKIARDERHTDVAALLRKPIRKRLYPEWGMGLASLRSPLELDRGRMVRMIEDVASNANTGLLSVEARILIRDFEHQARLAA